MERIPHIKNHEKEEEGKGCFDEKKWKPEIERKRRSRPEKGK